MILFFYHLQEIFQINTKKIIDTDAKTGLDASKISLARKNNKRVNATKDLMVNEIAVKKVQPKTVSEANQKLKKVKYTLSD